MCLQEQAPWNDFSTGWAYMGRRRFCRKFLNQNTVVKFRLPRKGGTEEVPTFCFCIGLHCLWRGPMEHSGFVAPFEELLRRYVLRRKPPAPLSVLFPPGRSRFSSLFSRRTWLAEVLIRFVFVRRLNEEYVSISRVLIFFFMLWTRMPNC